MQAIMVSPLLDQLAEKEARITQLEETVADLRSDIADLQDCMDQQEQYSRRNSLRFFYVSAGRAT